MPWPGGFSEGAPGPGSGTTHRPIEAYLEDLGEFTDDDGGYESDDSFDFLKTAREIDLEAVRVHEHEYEAMIAELLEDQLPS